MADKRLEELILRLQKKTAEGKISWERTARTGVFQAAFPNYSVQISRRQNRDDPEAVDYLLRVYDEDGQLIEEAVDTDFSDVQERFSAYTVMADTYSAARKIALGVDKAIDSLLKELGNE
jgi:hypothetical protein